MKKIIICIFTFFMLIVLCSCNTNNKLDEKNNKASKVYNFQKRVEDNKTIYKVEKKDYIVSEDETNYVLIDIDDRGVIVVELNPKEAPITVKNFKKLVSSKFYDNIIFHRVINNFMIQAGDPTGTGFSGSDETIKGEFKKNGINNNISHIRGTISMARAGGNPDTEATMNSASSQFFIVQQDSTYLDGNYAGFGKVIAGMTVVDSIVKVKTNKNDKPLEDIKINTMCFVNVGD